MALFKILKGQSQNLPSERHEGYAYFVTDTGEFYVDINNSDRIQLSAEKLSRTRSGETEVIEIDDLLLMENHIQNKENPHETTASQVGADPKGSADEALRNAKSYVDEKIAGIPTPDVSEQINNHNTSSDPHANMHWITSDTSEPGEPIPINADTLGGYPASDYMKKIDLSAKNITLENIPELSASNLQDAISVLFNMIQQNTTQISTKADTTYVNNEIQNAIGASLEENY